MSAASALETVRWGIAGTGRIAELVAGSLMLVTAHAASEENHGERSQTELGAVHCSVTKDSEVVYQPLLRCVLSVVFSFCGETPQLRRRDATVRRLPHSLAPLRPLRPHRGELVGKCGV